MAKVTPKVKIMLDKERTLRLDLNAMVEFEEMTGKSLISGVNMQDLAIKDIRILLWACLMHEDEDLTLKQVGAMFSIENMEEIGSILEKAFATAMPASKGKQPPLAVNRSVG